MKTFYDDLLDFTKDFDFYFNEKNNLNSKVSYRYAPAVEKEDHYEISILAAGLDKDDINITYKIEDSNRLVCIEFKSESDFVFKGTKKYYISSKIDGKNITSKLSKGILTIILPKDKSNVFEGNVKIETE